MKMNKKLTGICGIIIGLIWFGCDVFQPETEIEYVTETIYSTDTVYVEIAIIDTFMQIDTFFVYQSGDAFETANSVNWDYDTNNGWHVETYSKAIQIDDGIYTEVKSHCRLFYEKDEPFTSTIVIDSSDYYNQLEEPNQTVTFKYSGMIGYTLYPVGTSLDAGTVTYWSHWITYKKVIGEEQDEFAGN